jgi:adenylate cyclase
VYGPIGSARRLDFTVIGDVVNTGARLCSNAARGEVLISGGVRERCGELADVEFVPREPLTVKGKREPLATFTAKRRA